MSMNVDSDTAAVTEQLAREFVSDVAQNVDNLFLKLPGVDGLFSDGSNPILRYAIKGGRSGLNDSSNQQNSGGGRLRVSELTFWTLQNNSTPVITSGVFDGTVYDSVTIYKTITVGGDRVPSVELAFEFCVFTAFYYVGAIVCFQMNFRAYSHKLVVYGPDGNKLGQSGFSWNGDDQSLAAIT
jgi:hypothetical protein